jgi:predicted enzyme related to lactoylglutathione lyase
MGRPVVHFEIGCRDRARTERFFAELFDWNITTSGPAAMIDAEGDQGIDGHISSLGHEPHHYVTIYVEVDDLEWHITRAERLGGKRLVPPVEIPTGRFAWIADPDGNIIGLWTPKR